MRCVVCRVDDESVVRHSSCGGEDYGSAHRGECAGLLWEGFYVTKTGGDEDEHAWVLWKWKRRAAEVAGVPFTDPLPLDKSDREWAVIRARLGVPQ